jgi:uncharacterized protein
MLFAILGLLHAYVGWRILPDLPIDLGARFAGAFLLALSYGAMVLGFRARALRRSRWSDRITVAGLFATGWFSSLAVFTLLRELVLAAAILPLSRAHVHLLSSVSAATAVGLAVLATGVGFANARRRARIVRVRIPLADLPPALHGFTIAQVSDVHVGRTIKRAYVESIVRAVNGLEADLIAVTGDLVDGTVEELAAHTAPFGELRARHGAFFVTGNHEYYSGERPWMGELARLGLRVLMNEHVVLTHRGARIVVAGVTDFSAHHFDPAQRSDPGAAIAGAPADAGARILLAHQPRTAPGAARAGFDLQLSGHTHGGQFWPWMFFVRLQQPFTAGLHRLGKMWVYISRGTGYWGPPKRFGAPSEITLLELAPQTAGARVPSARRTYMRPALHAIAIGCASLLALGGFVGDAAAAQDRTSGALPTLTEPAPSRESAIQEIEVTGVRPGPRLWRVSKGDHVLWLLGTLDPLPKRMTWRSRQVESVIEHADLVLAADPAVSVHAGPISMVRLYLQYRRERKIPEKQSLSDVLSPPLYARFRAVEARFDPRDGKIEELRPALAARRLYERAISASDLTSRNDIQDEVLKLARRHGVTVQRTSLRLDDPRGILTEAGEIPRAAEIGCLDATVERLETDLPAMRQRAQAWAIGDVDALRALPYPKQREVCMSAAASSPRIRSLLDRAARDWQAALQEALATRRTTLAMKPIYDLIEPGGVLATLRAQGYTVEGP